MADRLPGIGTMARIAIGVCGEGRGHAARAATLMERLGGGHEFLVASTSEALDLLAARAGGTAARFLDVPGIRFQYRDGRLDVSRSIATGLWYGWRHLPGIVDRLTRAVADFGADLVITDFEPVLPRVARRLGLPLMSVDHQHFLVAYDLAALPRGLRWQASCMGLAVRMYVRGATDTIVSAFYRPPLRRGWEHVVQVGPLLRRAVLQARPRDGGFVVSYLRRHTPPHVLEALAAAGLPVRVYGLGRREPLGPVSFHDIAEAAFVDDLAGCTAVVAAGGNQLIGEALHLGKPVLALPESAHAEQCMNGHFLRAMDAGDFQPLERVDGPAVRGFLAARDRYRPALERLAGRMDGAGAVVQAVEGRLRSLGLAPPSREAAA
jgi:uncharacterized protein (TIGR00661 family)